MYFKGQNAEAMFEQLDADHSGFLDRSQVGMLLQKLGKKMSAAGIEQIMKEMGEDGNDEVSFEEFKAWWDLNGGACRPLQAPSSHYLRVSMHARLGESLTPRLSGMCSFVGVRLTRMLRRESVEEDGSSETPAGTMLEVSTDEWHPEPADREQNVRLHTHATPRCGCSVYLRLTAAVRVCFAAGLSSSWPTWAGIRTLSRLSSC